MSGQRDAEYFAQAVGDNAWSMDKLAERAGYTTEQMDAMIGGMSTGSAVIIEAGQATEMFGERIEGIDTALMHTHDGLANTESMNAYINNMHGLIGVLDEAGIGVEGLSETTFDLMEQFKFGGLSAEYMSDTLEGEFTSALVSAAEAGDITAQQMRALQEQINRTKLDWSSGTLNDSFAVREHLGSDDLDALAMGLPEGMSTDASAAWGLGGLGPDIDMGAGFFTGMGEEVIEATEEFRIMGDEIELLKMRLKDASRVGDEELSASLRTQIIDLQELNEVILMPIEGMEKFGIATGHSAGATFDLNGLIAGSIESMPIWTEAMAGAGLGAGGLTDRIEDLLDSLDLAGVNTMGLSELAMDLTDQFELGEISSQKMSEQLQEEFNKALLDAAAQGLLTTLQVQELGRAIEDIPSYKRVHIDQQYTTSGNRDSSGSGSGSNTQSHHIGGMVLHQGGGVWPRLHTGALVSNLAHNEVPIIARRGEFVVREEAVNANTLPTLHALNQTGNNAGYSGPQTVINGPLVEVNGNILGSDDNFEDLVRQIETKLREVVNSRY